MPAAAPICRYQQAIITGRSLLCAAGEDRQAWEACRDGQRCLRREADGLWCGRLPDQARTGSADSLLQLALPLARAAWGDAGSDPWPWLSLSCSKGDTPRWFVDPADPLPLASWPGALDGHLAAQLGWRGHRGSPAVAACSTGLTALLAAADQVERGAVPAALVGAVDRSLQELLLAGFDRLGVLARGEAPSAFTGAGSGFAPGEGGACLRLQPRGAAGDWALRAGVRLGDASHETHCDDTELLAAALQALWEQVPEPEVIITHGTGTRRGDAYEAAALEAGPWRAIPRLAWKPLIGHCLGASGLVELAIALHGPWRRLWKLSLGFGGHIALVACERLPDRAVRPGPAADPLVERPPAA